MASVSMPAVRARRRMSAARRRDLFDGLLFASPFVLGVLFFWLGPMLYSLYLVVHDWNLITPPRYVGLRNVERLLNDPLVNTSLTNTAFYTFVGVPLQLTVAFSLALMLNQAIRGRSLYRTIFYMPAITPAVASAVVWVQILNPEFGVLNAILGWFGIGPIKWLFDPTYAKPAMILMSLWFVGPQMVVFLAGLQGVPQTLLEAASIDGANSWRRFWHVTVPIVSPVIFFNLIIGIIGSFQVFTQAFVMTQGGPRDATLFFVLYIYRNAFQYFRMGYAATLAWVLFAIIVVFTAIQFLVARRWVYYAGKD
jgi:multiple sugar transport system permease protein